MRIKKLFIAMVAIILAAPAYAVTYTTCENMGYTAGDTCEGIMDVVRETSCLSENCFLFSCRTRCICAGSRPSNCDSETSTSNCSASNCASSEWVSEGNGVYSRTYKYCDTSDKCVDAGTQYACGGGYYGSKATFASKPTCTACSGYTYAPVPARHTGSTTCTTPLQGQYSTNSGFGICLMTGRACDTYANCDAGYYCPGDGQRYRCPTIDGMAGSTRGTSEPSIKNSPADITDCYIEAGDFTDAKGNGTIANMCYYISESE